ncbi:MAG: hypothetical protein M3Y30_09915, partial [Gemmatimonadota bacterium]|nr:hypothetical protein [Gemmatimonadota bacterium]
SNKDDWRGVTRYVLASARPEDGVLFLPSYTIAPFDYYRERSDLPDYPPAVANFADGLEALQKRFGRVWFIYTPNGVDDQGSSDSLSRRFPVLADRRFVGIRVTLYDTRQSPLPRSMQDRGALFDTTRH